MEPSVHTTSTDLMVDRRVVDVNVTRRNSRRKMRLLRFSDVTFFPVDTFFAEEAKTSGIVLLCNGLCLNRRLRNSAFLDLLSVLPFVSRLKINSFIYANIVKSYSFMVAVGGSSSKRLKPKRINIAKNLFPKPISVNF